MATTKTPIKDLDIISLLKYEEATRIICQRYENSVKRYDGTIANDSAEYKNFSKYINLRVSLLNEIEKRLDTLA